MSAPTTTVDVDEVAVYRAMHGDPVRLTKPERREAVRQLTHAGASARVIADRLRVSDRTVKRDRVRVGIASWPRGAAA